MDFVKPLRFYFDLWASRLIRWLYVKLPFNMKYSIKLAILAGQFKKQSNDLLLEDVNKEKLEK